MNRVSLERKVLSENDRIASKLRGRFHSHGTFCVNLISSPGSGKTSLLERTLEELHPQDRVAVLTGDLQTENDAIRLRRFGFPVKQITTGGTCHLDAQMIERALSDWTIPPIDTLFIENVGNLVCPASYDLGEAAKVVLLSVTEGEDKPLKYPSTFLKASLLLLTKLDLLRHVPFDIAAAERHALRVNPHIQVVCLSSFTGEGMREWRCWLETQRGRDLETRAASVI
jgi:hydrogenase nickel incorporation protein HypB